MKYTGTIVEESLENPSVIKTLNIVSSEYFREANWHLHDVKVTEDQAKNLASSIKSGPWYMHFWHGNEVIVVYRNKVFEFNHNDKPSWQPAIEYGLSIGIPKEQLDFLIGS